MMTGGPREARSYGSSSKTDMTIPVVWWQRNVTGVLDFSPILPRRGTGNV